jgi:hypothetical protein
MLSGMTAMLLFSNTSFAREPDGDYVTINFVGAIDAPPHTLWVVPDKRDKRLISLLHDYVPVSAAQFRAVRDYIKTTSCKGRRQPSDSEQDAYVVKERIAGVVTVFCALQQSEACRVAGDLHRLVLKNMPQKTREHLIDYQDGIGCPKAPK